MPSRFGQRGADHRYRGHVGENRLVAYGFNRDNAKSQDARATLTGAPQLSRKGTAYILAFGINSYANREFDLKYAVSDADLFATEVRAAVQRLGSYASVQVAFLRDAEATRANLRLAIERLSGSASGSLPQGAPPALGPLSRAQPEDLVLLYFAGHGVARQARYYLLPHDLGYRGPREKAGSEIDSILEHALSDRDLERLLEGVDAGQVALVIDACNSGQALESGDHRQGPLNSKGLAQLAYDKGMYILTAAQAFGAAIETARLGHGYLTYALVEEGLRLSLADTLPTDGVLTANEWFEYAARRVPQLQTEALGEAIAQGRNLDFEADRGAARSGRLQTPRVFYRRDISGAPLVIANVGASR